MKPPQSYSFRSIYPRVHTKITPSYSFWSIYLRVRTKITPYDTHQPTLMSPRYSNVIASIRDLIIRYPSNNFRFIILNPTERTSKSAPGFLLEKQGGKFASTPMHKLPQCHLGNPQVECQKPKIHMKWINMIPHCDHGYLSQDIHQVFSNPYKYSIR